MAWPPDAVSRIASYGRSEACPPDAVRWNASYGEAAGNDERRAASTGALPIPQQKSLQSGIGESGTWLVSLTEDVTVAEELVVDGHFYEEDDTAKPAARKLQLSAPNADQAEAAAYTLTVPKMTVKSENFKIEGGTVKGDIYVEANGFYLEAGATVDGDIYFPNQELKTTAQIYGKVTGLVR